MFVIGSRGRSSRILALSVAIIVILARAARCSPIVDDYMKMRQSLIAEESLMRIGGNLALSSDEKIVSDIIVKEKVKLMENSRLNRTAYLPSLSFFVSKKLIQNTTLFNLIRRMPKGAALHLHDTSLTSLDWLIKNATYRDNIYMCLGSDDLLTFRAYLEPPTNSSCAWKSVAEERAKYSNKDEFDLSLKNNLSMVITDPLTTYQDNDKVWVRFGRYFGQVQDLVYYKPIFRDYFWRALEEMRNENILYLELRSTMEGLYDLDGTVHDTEACLLLYRSIVQEFVKQYPDFIGAKFIKSGVRRYSQAKILDEIKTSMRLNQQYPDAFAGYDLSGNEAYFNPLIFYIEALLYPSRQTPPYKLPYFLHVGETIWQGSAPDLNLLEAILLNASRIGHGFSLPKHPKLVQMVKDRKIPIEVNPISNQMLRLVDDLRNHPMVPLLANDFPIVISSDDIATWEALPLSHDFYMAFTNMVGKDVDITFFKQLAINSITYSAMNDSEKKAARTLWDKHWNTYIQEVVLEFSSDRTQQNENMLCQKLSFLSTLGIW